MALVVMRENGTPVRPANAYSRPGIAEAKEIVIGCVAQGITIKNAMERVGRSVKTMESWRRDDKEFAARVNDVRKARSEGRSTDEIAERSADFVTWRKEFLGFDTPLHMLQWLDVIEGRDPRDLHPAAEYDRAEPDRIIINCPPYHAKSQFFIDYITWLICNNPNVRILIVSKKQDFAKKFVYQVTQRLTSTRFARLQAAYAPKGGFRPAQGEGAFSATMIYVAGRTEDIKDPTLEAVGLGGQIYGTRADLILLDDVVVGSNAAQYEEQAQWLESEVTSRVQGGTVLMVGTRLRSMDLYKFLRDDTRYLSEETPWTYLRQPMVLEYGDESDGSDWVTLWPRTNMPPADGKGEPDENGLYPMWPGGKAAKIRGGSPGSTWSLVYQQADVSEDSTFQPKAIKGATDGRRWPGKLIAGAIGHPKRGGEGMITIAAMDPAMSGDTYTLVIKVDKATGHIWLENAWLKTHPPASYFRTHMKEVTIEYGVDEWVVERQGFQNFLVDDPELNDFLSGRGVSMIPHYTGNEKNDPDFGVASCAMFFGRLENGEDAAKAHFVPESNRLHLPRTTGHPALMAMVDQLIAWQPGIRGNKLKQDGPMALWFAVKRAKVHLGYRTDEGEPVEVTQQHLDLPFINPKTQHRQTRVRGHFAGLNQRKVYGARR